MASVVLSQPRSVFPSTYRSDTSSEEITDTKVEGEVKLGGRSSRGREDTRSSKEDVDINIRDDRRRDRDDIRVYEERDRIVRDNRHPEVELTREKYQGPAEYKDTKVDIEVDRRGVRDSIDVEYDRRQNYDRIVQDQLDITERDYRRRTDPSYDVEYERRRPITDVRVETDIEVDRQHKRDMGYYDDDGNYHSFRRGIERAADRIRHPFHHHHHHHDHDDVDVKRTSVVADEVDGPSRVRGGTTETVRFVEPRRGGYSPNTVTIPCHFIRIGDLVILQGRPCEVIRISTSAQTGQYRYLGVDLFTKKLQEESSFNTNPEPSVYVQSMLGPVFKQYRILDLRDDGRIVCMTETGDVKQGLSVVDNNHLFDRIERSFADGRGSVRALVINDGGRELIVDYKVIHGSRL